MKTATKDTTTATHTPGPWEVVECTGFQRIFATTPDGIGECVASTEPLLFESPANAKLIAAAPDLLAALEQGMNYLNAIDEMNPSNNHGTVGQAVRAAFRAAIAKAITGSDSIGIDEATGIPLDSNELDHK